MLFDTIHLRPFRLFSPQRRQEREVFKISLRALRLCGAIFAICHWLIDFTKDVLAM
jgi:hypothetical protein